MTTTETPTMTTITAPGDQLARALTNAAVFASSDKVRPILNSVLLERADDGTMRCVAADSYMLFVEAVPTAAAPEDFVSCLIGLDEVKAIAATLKGVVADIALRFTPDTVTVKVGTTEMTLPLTAGDFPDYGRLVPDPLDEDVATAGRFGFNPVFLARFAKVAVEGFKKKGDCPLRIFAAESALKPCRFELGERIHGAIMPVRL